MRRINYRLRGAGLITCLLLSFHLPGLRAADETCASTNTAAPLPAGPSENPPGEQAPTNLVTSIPPTDTGVATNQAIALTNQVPVAAREEAGASLLPAVEALSARLAAIEQALALQHQLVLQASQSSNRTILTVAGCFAVAGLLGVLLAALILARSLNHFSEVMVMAVPASHQLPRAPAVEALGPGDLASTGPSPVEQVTAKFLGAIEQLEKRIVELEQSTQRSFKEIGSGQPAASAASLPAKAPLPASPDMEFSVSVLQQKQYPTVLPSASEISESKPGDPAAVWLGKGQALLNLGQADEALACFDQAVALSPNHADALVKRGMALEKLQRMEAAIESYDRAIAANGSMTLAYLYKGAVCNRLQRFREALECYENALKSEQKLVAS